MQRCQLLQAEFQGEVACFSGTWSVQVQDDVTNGHEVAPPSVYSLRIPGTPDRLAGRQQPCGGPQGRVPTEGGCEWRPGAARGLG